MNSPSATYDIDAIDTVLNPITPEIIELGPSWRSGFHQGTFGRDDSVQRGVTIDALITELDAAGVDHAFLVAACVGPADADGCFHVPYELVHAACEAHPDRFSGVAGLDPTTGMDGVRKLEWAVKELGFVGAHFYPHWFELAPDHRRWYPFYAKCAELDIPVQMQIGQSLIYDTKRPLRSVGQPLTLDTVACELPEVKLVGIHVGVPWVDEMMFVATKHPNVHIVADAHAPKHWPAQFVNFINTYGQDKVIFGTDYPVLTHQRMRDEVEDLGIRDGPKRKFLRDNAIELWKLDR